MPTSEPSKYVGSEKMENEEMQENGLNELAHEFRRSRRPPKSSAWMLRATPLHTRRISSVREANIEPLQ